MVVISNTIRFSFPQDAARPSWDEISALVKSLKVSFTDMDTWYKLVGDKCVCLKFKSESAFKDAVQNNAQTLRFHYANGASVEVQMSDAAGNFQYVRVCGLPPEVPDHDIALVLGKYGKVKRIVREKIPAELGFDVYNGARGVLMDVEKEIPSALHFHNWNGHIYYEGNKETCFTCKQKGHLMNSCPNKKPRSRQEKDKKEVGQPNTYAGVVNRAASLENSNQVSESLAVERAIRILEEDIKESEEVVDPAINSKGAIRKNKKMEPKRQRSTDSETTTSGTLKKRNTNSQSSGDSDGCQVSVTDTRPALETVKSLPHKVTKYTATYDHIEDEVARWTELFRIRHIMAMNERFEVDQVNWAFTNTNKRNAPVTPPEGFTFNYNDHFKKIYNYK